MMSEPRFKVGDMVDTRLWDDTVPPHKKIGTPAKVISVMADRRCGSGWRVCVLGKRLSGGMDEGWFNPVATAAGDRGGSE